MEQFLNGLTLSARTRENVRLKCSQFFNFCIRRKWISENPAKDLAKKIESHDVEILSVDAAERLLRTAQISSEAEGVVPYLAVSLFGGLRPAEAQGLRWERIHFETRQIEVLKSTSKTRQTRFVVLEPLLAEWLLPYRKSHGKIVGPNFVKYWKSVRQAAGYAQNSQPWMVDILRHSFGSYWLAIHQNRAQLAEEMGNSVEVIKKHYRRAIPRQIAEKFWQIRPIIESVKIVKLA